MNATERDLDIARRHEARLLLLAGAAYVAIVAVAEWATLETPLDPLGSGVYTFLSIALAARYIPWSKLPFDSPVRHVLPWAVLGLGLVVAIAVVLQGHATLFFYLAAAEGGLTFLRRRDRLLWVVAISAVAFLVHLFFHGWPAAGTQALEIVPAFLLLVIAADLLLRQESQRTRVERLLAELREAHLRLTDYTAQAEALAIAEERTRLAREIHDTVGHTLTALDVQVQLVRRLPADHAEARREALERAGSLIEEGLADSRRAVKALRPGALDTFSLPEAIASLLANFRVTTGIDAIWQVQGEAVSLPPSLGVPLYRAAQEALTNVTRYAAASQVRVTLSFAPEEVALTVEDDGRGGEANPGFGLRGMRERAEALGGEFSAGPGPERGFRVEMKLPR
ncbi:MAG: sensor histidine kinase [Chloroflexi bacterium]|nr:sensor histidine kinase [Chloroflexota bacterium]